MSTMFIVMRTVHLVLAAIWFGAVFFMAMYLGPVVGEVGPPGGAVMAGIVKRGFDRVMAIVGGLTVVTGIGLYSRLTQGFDTSLIATKTGMIFAIGGLFGFAGAAIGGAVVGRTSKALFALGTTMSTMPDGPEKAAAMQEVGVLRARIASGSRLLLIVLTVAMVLMAVGRYVR
jgi:hypothetical protein